MKFYQNMPKWMDFLVSKGKLREVHIFDKKKKKKKNSWRIFTTIVYKYIRYEKM